MDTKMIEKIQYLLTRKRVMTLCVKMDDLPWASPVYFFYNDKIFFFFSNPQSRHIKYGMEPAIVSNSIFHDSDSMEDIFGIQMTGSIKKISHGIAYINSIKNYVNKFDFLSRVFGPEIFENPAFFLDKFKSELYGFYPETIFLSDNSKSEEKRISVDLKDI